MAILDINRILVPIDFSAPSKQALATGRELAQKFGAELHVLHVLEKPSYPGFYGAGAVTMYGKLPDLKQRAEEALRDLLSEAEVEVSGVVIEGRAQNDILEYAHDHAIDLIVIASKGLSGVKRVLLGSVASQIVRKAPCPVFVVRGEEAMEETSSEEANG
jgi:nucleotide-binding universal stress UspA family protein